MNSPRLLNVGTWRVDGPANRMAREDQSISLEPKVMDLLLVLAESPGEVVSREALMERLWPGVVVGEDTLARTVSKLRGALDDDPKEPAYIETIPKRGYRLIAEVSILEPAAAATRQPAVTMLAGLIAVAVLSALAFLFLPPDDSPQSEATLLVDRADDFYMRFSQADNAAAIDLYERAIAQEPDHAGAHAGLANSLTQRVIRWPEEGEGTDSLTDALDKGLNKTPQALELLARARALAERGVRLAPDDPNTLKALGLVLSTSGELSAARGYYERAVVADPDAWAPLVNLSELARREGNLDGAIDYLSRGYDAMKRVYDEEPQRVGPWHAPVGVTIAQFHEENGSRDEAEIWYRRVLRLSPYDPNATAGLAQLLASSGDLRAALSLCRNLNAAGASHETCESLLMRDSPAP